MSSSSSSSFSASAAKRSRAPDAPPTIVHLPDLIRISSLKVRMNVGVDGWERTQVQPIHIDVSVHTDVSSAGSTDHLPYSIHYGVLVKELEKHCSAMDGSGAAPASSATPNRYRSLEALAEGLAKVCIFICKAPRVTLRVSKPRSLLHAKSAGVEIVRTPQDFIHDATGQAATIENVCDARDGSVTPERLASLSLSPTSQSAYDDKVLVTDLCISAILGVNPWERVDPQIIRFNLVIYSGLERLRQAQAAGKAGGQAVGEEAAAAAAAAAAAVDRVTRPQNYRTIVRSISSHVEASSYKTVESLATSVARVAVLENRVERIKVRVDKPSAIMWAESAGVEVDRDRAFFERERREKAGVEEGRDARLNPIKKEQKPAAPVAAPAAVTAPAATPKEVVSPLPTTNGTTTPSTPTWHVAAIALGSNLGHRHLNIENAVRLLSSTPGCRVIDTSFMYETKPMYLEDQPRFVNAACRIATTLTPHELLRATQSIELALGRDKRGVPIKGPRSVDLDIIFYDRLELSTPDLVLPHPGVSEREFVLRPLADILPLYQHPTSRRTVAQLLGILVNSEAYDAQRGIRRIMCVPGARKESVASGEVLEPVLDKAGEDEASGTKTPADTTTTTWAWGERTLIMGILNATPDSFSDGGDHLASSDALSSARRMVQAGADVLDVGGMSTAPNAEEISPEEEIQRVVPVIKAIREAGVVKPISIDTFRADVAEAALRAGANIINDVTGGTRDAAILDVAVRWGVPIVLMHMRGDSKTMGRLTKYENDDVVEGVRRELALRVDEALRRGVRRWNIILDPGIGFAKDQRGNTELLRDLRRLNEGGAPSIPTPAVAPAPGSGVQRGGLLGSRRSSMKNLAEAFHNSSIGAETDGQGNGASSSTTTMTTDPYAPNATLTSLPLLIGASRKRFLGSIVGRPQDAPKGRIHATSAACTAAVAGGADVLRVHDVAEMGDVAKVADAVFRLRD